MKVVNFVQRAGGDMVIAGNREAIKDLAGALLQALAREGVGRADVLNTKGTPYAVHVRRADGITELLSLPTS